MLAALSTIAKVKIGKQPWIIQPTGWVNAQSAPTRV
ncbi:hypothetical protein PSPTO_4629 [Pseudomonas syringae pv. tomato str. DC3000]|uniref:Uncharacterized protein n=1 Tax=Pseudomonas syringae pv. tomato (strain ATCC BAA-871 / DC3000) TaxID=223283 RepID=Q87WC4_PSESM|nr:hypothetical protein PSPTO_4629 [Pseudomonas syringae pv. tomato str. DC3000]